MTHLVNNENLDLYSEEATLSKFIHEGRPTTTKMTFVTLPSLQPIYLQRMLERYTSSTTRFPSQSFDETGCDFFLFPTPGKKHHITIDPEILSPYFTPSQVTKQYGTYMASPAKKTTSAIIEVKIDKSLQFQVNRLNIA